ncbi:sigma-70 family RNA polymerase sigma factor [Pseudonocardia sp. MH-G8]|uniref:sigma-70 family RNA polymerase sigma factor n=1 Tax=Pseudonocardia sp. MH-G8 TaxID=1854588 RepID=UPI000BA07A1B|nr:sigma-70 family RNA polymerase sigma factor [Pseudonocardia sp. MH-G8]OZM77028.1 RNA polymerase subunit sigma-70 [Pseudonocardia sp. MH-G8]
MVERDWLTDRFEAHRTHLRSVAYRVLGSHAEADDAVQEAWLRLARSDSGQVENLGGWLTTIVARVSLDMLRSRTSRREELHSAHSPDLDINADGGTGPEHEVLLVDAVGSALLVVLDTLTPAERLAFVLHDLFAVPFEEIAPIVDRSRAAARQLASRARRRVRGATPGAENDLSRQRAMVEAFLAASRDGDFTALMSLLGPDVVLSSDAAAVRAGASEEARGVAAVATVFAGRAKAARLALVDGAAGAVWGPAGQPRVVFEFTTSGGKIVRIDILADPEYLAEVELSILG